MCIQVKFKWGYEYFTPYCNKILLSRFQPCLLLVGDGLPRNRGALSFYLRNRCDFSVPDEDDDYHLYT
jgi:hypothetical protein